MSTQRISSDRGLNAIYHDGERLTLNITSIKDMQL